MMSRETAFQGYTVPKPKGPSFMAMIRAEREGLKLFKAWANAPLVELLDEEIENDFLELRPMRVEIYP